MHPATTSSGPQTTTESLRTGIQVWPTTIQVWTTTFKRTQLLFGCWSMEDKEQTRQMYTLQDMRQSLIPKFRVQGYMYKVKINLGVKGSNARTGSVRPTYCTMSILQHQSYEYVTRSLSIAASRRPREGGAPPPFPLMMVDSMHPCLPDEDGFFHLSFLSIWLFCRESYTLPVSCVVLTHDIVC